MTTDAPKSRVEKAEGHVVYAPRQLFPIYGDPAKAVQVAKGLSDREYTPAQGWALVYIKGDFDECQVLAKEVVDQAVAQQIAETVADSVGDVFLCSILGRSGDVLHLEKKTLTSSERKKLSESDFAIPEDRAYPIHDEVHARAALQRVSQFGSPEEKKRVKGAVARKYPKMDIAKECADEEDMDEDEMAMHKTSVLQAVNLSKKTFATLEKARAWVEAAGLSADIVKEHPESWTFLQAQEAIGQLTKQAVAPGVEAEVSTADAFSHEIAFSKFDEEKRIVYGIVFAPNVVDSQGDWMTKGDIEEMAHEFLKAGYTDRIDVQHDWQKSGSRVVESWIAKAGDPSFPEGAWIMGVQVSPPLWDRIKKGEIKGFSMAGSGCRTPEQLEIEEAA